uniref:F-box domain-containing protein n=1 Tax=Graphocephala atropunctata TaxID=36148 RepID=A0A1B6KWZ0_9HEMI
MADSTENDGENSQEIKVSSDSLPTNSVSKPGNGVVEALLVEEYPAMSTAMRNLTSSLENPTLEEIVVVVLYILIVESGFVPFPSEPVGGDYNCGYNANRLRLLTASPKSWLDGNGVYRLYFTLVPFSESKCKLVCVPVGSCLVANMYSTCSDKTFAMVINPADYVALYPPQIIFKRLKSLSLNFKDKVVIPIRTVILNEMHQTSVGLLALPVEVLLKIVSYLRVDDFLKLTSTCKYFFHTFSYDEHIWKQYCLLKFCRPGDLGAKETHRAYYQRKINFRNRVTWRFPLYINLL